MTASRRLIAATTVAIVVLAAIAAATELSGHYQVLPFSSWELFSRMPDQERLDYGLRLTSIDGTRQEPPVYFESSGLPDAASPTAYELVQDIGRATTRGDLRQAEAEFDTFAGRYLGGVDAEVEVVQRVYDVLDVRDCDCFLEQTVIGTDSTSEPAP